jgi:Tfp pilus assembly protein PilN
MIKINLLDSVTDRQGGAVVAVVERKAADPMTRMILMAGAVFVLMVGVIAFDIINTSMNRTTAEEELKEQQQIAVQYEAMLKEQNELNEKIKNINMRIEAIKALRSTQAGPSAVLEALKERIIKNPSLFLDSVEQKGGQLTISGNSPDETVVTTFGRDLEFSDGLFSNLNIETTRKENPNIPASTNPEAPRPEIVNFVIRCSYTPTKNGNTMNGATPANAPQTTTTTAPTPPQVAKN